MDRNEYQYGWGSIILHWSVALLAFWLFWNGQQIGAADTRELRYPIILTHNSIAILLVAAALIRTFVRVKKGMVDHPAQSPLLDKLALLVPWLLLGVILVILISGILTWWAVEQPIAFFDLFEFPSPLSEDLDFHHQTEVIHAYAVDAAIPLVLLHIAGALKHLVARDGIFGRMFIPRG